MGVGRDLSGLRKDGSEFPVEIGLNPIQNSKDLLVLAAIVDITERKRAEEARASLAAIVESSEDAIISKTLDGTIVSWNRGAERLYGYTAEEVVGKPLSILLPPDRADDLPGIFERLRRGERISHFETVRLHKDGSRIDVSLTISAIKNEDGQIIGASKIARDITERKRAEKDLHESKENLEKAVAELQAKDDEVRAMTQQLWQAAKLASVGELAASIAHELNNPLATVSLRIESVLARTPADDPRRRALEIIEQETKRMGELVANLLQFSRRGEEKISTVDVREELTKAVELIQHHLRKRQVTVVQELAPDTPTISRRPAEAAAGLLESAHQRQRRHAPGRHADAAHRAGYAGQRQARRADRVRGHRRGHSARTPGEGHGALLHHEGRRERDGAGAGDLPPRRSRTPRHHPDPQRSGQGDHRAHRAARQEWRQRESPPRRGSAE